VFFLLKKRYICGLSFIFLIFLFCSGVLAGEMYLISDTMRYDPDKGIIYAEGNVKFTGEGMVISADKGEGSVDGSRAVFMDNVRGSGMLSGEKVEFTCDVAETGFSPDNFYSLNGKVDCKVGGRTLLAEKADMRGDSFSALKVTRFYDASQKVELSCNTLKGSVKNGEIMESVAHGNVSITMIGKDNAKTFVNGEKAVYSKDRGSLVVTGNARARQGLRDIKADSLVLFPDSNRIEAVGRSTLTIKQKRKVE